MKCEEARRSLYESIDGELGPPQERTLRQHVAACPDCATAFWAIETVSGILVRFAEAETPDDFTARVMARVPASRRRVFPWRRGSLVAAVLCLCLLGATLGLVRILAQPQIVVADYTALIEQDGDRLVVPAEQVVQGDVTVYRATLVVLGRVLGDIHLVGSTLEIGEGGEVTGQVINLEASPSVRLRVAMAELWDDLRRVLWRP
ncbi:MAG: zf-HC2 domain-containing protein [Bacillota bacterium]|jgi:anti-sigma factor (TIGR02949 family)